MVGAYGFEPHELRAAALGEIHARPFTRAETPSRMLLFAFTTDATGATAAVEALVELARSRGIAPPDTGAKQIRLDFSPARLVFERHGEFVTYSWSFPGGAEPFRPAADELQSVMRLLPQPGPLLVAADLHLIAAADAPDDFMGLFAGPAVAASSIDEGRATIASDFSADAFGFVRFLVIDHSLSPQSAGALTQRLLEIETYRMLALLGLPVAQRLSQPIRRIEEELPQLLLAVEKGRGIEADRALLHRLTAIATELETGSSESLFRLGATRAYHELVRARLDSIRESRMPHYSTFASFLSRRLTPAMRTCATIEQRQASLSSKIARIAELLRTRVDIELESQNADQIRQMAERVRLQLRLQQTVEGLSIAAITYYVSSVLHLLFEGAHAGGVHVDPSVATGASVPVVLAAVAFVVWRIRHAHKE
ncbi:MAG: DUF3422 domain-containing protein [Methylobacteriaceae bacterium]|nr:DUF3422 domain-containing protein [Rhodoblastus sp.]MCC0001614.1 DUF3422 domain-containing protein [Methylobacteriaceae bacterium]MCO5087903.1 DUF3422 domain-containing protein [Methylobacteriaceae bacterium]HPG01841.1 DUF3422 domain-containing protein [Rhodoblastus sp.]